jgi:hypothetical protein
MPARSDEGRKNRLLYCEAGRGNTDWREWKIRVVSMPLSLAVHRVNPHGIGTVDESIESRNLTTLARSAALLSVSTPAVPALR